MNKCKKCQTFRKAIDDLVDKYDHDHVKSVKVTIDERPSYEIELEVHNKLPWYHHLGCLWH